MISFLLRVRNESDALRRSLESLRGLELPHTIHIILHRCTDASREVSEDARRSKQPIEIVDYELPISRPGLETAATPSGHDNSLITFYRFCLKRATHPWVFKWDADFVATRELLVALPSLVTERRPVAYRLRAASSSGSCEEPYLSNCSVSYSKHVFWEVPTYRRAPEIITPGVSFEHASDLAVVKLYWREPAWFADTGNDIERRYRRLLRELGIEREPAGAARGGAPDTDAWYRHLRGKWADLLARDIVTD